MLLTHASHPDPFEANGMPPTYDSMHYCPVLQAIAYFVTLARKITFRNKIPAVRVQRLPVLTRLHDFRRCRKLWGNFGQGGSHSSVLALEFGTFVVPDMLRRSKIFIVTGLRHAIRKTSAMVEKLIPLHFARSPMPKGNRLFSGSSVKPGLSSAHRGNRHDPPRKRSSPFRMNRPMPHSGEVVISAK